MFVYRTHSSSRSSVSLYECGPRAEVSNNSDFSHNFDYVMENITEQIQTDDHHYAFYSIESPSPAVHALAQCHGDLLPSACEICFDALKKRANSCLPSDSARIFLDGCFLRYDHYDFFKEAVDPIHDKFNCSKPYVEDESLSKQFEEKVTEVIMNVTNGAKKARFRFVEEKGGIATVYALAQCWKTLDDGGCSQCLDEAAVQLKGCSSSGEGRAMLTGCYVRFSTEKFFSTVYQKKDNSKICIYLSCV